MKKIGLLIAIACLGIATTAAQSIQFGAKAGINLAKLSEDYDEDVENKTSFHLGVMAEIPVATNFSIQPELLYSEQGTKDAGDDDEEVRLNYLTLPVMAKLYLVEGLSVEAGPQFGLLLKGEIEDNGETTDVKDISKSTDIGFALGLGYKLDMGLMFGARYFFGSDINDVEGDSDKIKNKVFQISIGYFFN